jgi:citrate lyase gamma subunit
MGMRVLQLLMIVLLTGCVAWAFAIFFGPWALTKYLEGQAGDAVEVSGLRVTPKLAVTASRVQVSDAGVVTASLRGVEVDWRLLTGDEPAVLISVSNGGFAGSLSVEDLQVTVAQADTAGPLKISGTAARAGDPNSVSAADVKFEANTDYSFQLLRRVSGTTGSLTTQHPTNVSASTSQIEVDQVDLRADLLRQGLGGVLALTNVVAAGPDLSMPEAYVKFALADGLLSLSLGARDLISETADVAVSGLTGSVEFDAARVRLAGPIDLALNDFAWKDIRLPVAAAKVTPGDKQFKVSVEGTSLGSEITLVRRYIGRAPDASFAAKFDTSSLGGNLQISGDVWLAAAQQPVELDVSFQGTVAGVSQPVVCTEVACEISDVTYEYSLNVAGETLSGTSSCLEPTCSSGARTHELSTTDTNKFFANLQGVNLISPLVLGGAYAQMLQGVAVGTGHKINF